MLKPRAVDSSLEQSTARIEKRMWRGRATYYGGGAAAGAIAGAAIGSLGGPLGATLGAVVGAAIGAGAGATIKRSNGYDAARDARLDKELGVIGGDVGVPSLKHPPERSADPRAAASPEERADAKSLEDGLHLDEAIPSRSP